jgi:hypothetical protein
VQDLSIAITQGRRDSLRLLVVESFLLPTQPRIMRMLDHFIWLDANHAASKVLMERKFCRSHFGKVPYKDMGVRKEEFMVWWNHYVFSRYEEYKPNQVPDNTIIIDCLIETADAINKVKAVLHD